MATYIQGLYDSPLSVTPFTPDYNFLQTVLKTKESEYEQGFAQVKNLYNSLLTSKASNSENVEMQKAYLADAENKLKSLASVDLSVPQNVDMARSVFKTYLNDSELMHDINVTKISDSQLAVGQSFLQSDDPKKRAMHSSLADEYVSTVPVNELKWAKRGDGSITKVRPRYYVPAINLSEKFKDFLDASKYTGFTETANGNGYIFRTAGGKTVEKGLYNLMNGLLTGDDRKYFDMWGEVLYNRGLNEYVSNRGLSVDQARRELATDFYEQDLRFNKDQKGSAQEDYDRLIAKAEMYRKKGDLTEAEASDLDTTLQSANEYKQSIDYFSKKVAEMEKPDQKEAIFQKYYDGKWGVLSDMLIQRDMKSISSAMGILTTKNEIKANDPYFKNLEHVRGMMQIEINRMKATAGESEDGTTGGGGGGGTKKAGKPTEAEYKRAVANEILPSGLQEVPQSQESQLKTFWDNWNTLQTVKLQQGNIAIEKLLGGDFNKQGNVSISTLLNVLSKKKEAGQLNDLVAEFPDQYTWGSDKKKGAMSDSPDKRAFDHFLNLYAKNAGGSGDQTSEFYKYLTSKQSTDKGATYADVYDFLLKKAEKTYDQTKDAMTDKQKLALVGSDGPFGIMKKVGEIEKVFEGDQEKVKANILSKMDTFIDSKKYNTAALVVTDPNGYQRFATKDEVKKRYDDVNRIIGYKIVDTNTGRTLGGPYTTRPIINPKFETQTVEPVFTVDENTRMGVNRLYQDYDKIQNQFNSYVGQSLSANKFTLDEKTLKTFGTYMLNSRADVEGEIAERALPILLSAKNLIISDPKNDLATGVDIKGMFTSSVLGSSPGAETMEKVQGVLNELGAAITTTGSAWDASIIYKQFTGDRGDNRKEYVIRPNLEKLNSLIGFYTTEKTADPVKAKALTWVKENGLQIRTTDPVPGGLNEYGVVERYHQANGFYVTSDDIKDLYWYRIDKKADNSGYYISSDSHYFVKDPITGQRTQINFPSDVEFPANSSFTSIIDMVNRMVHDRIIKAETTVESNLKNPGTKKITASEIFKKYGY